MLNVLMVLRGVKQGLRGNSVKQFCDLSEKRTTTGEIFDKIYWQLYIYRLKGLIHMECLFRYYFFVWLNGGSVRGGISRLMVSHKN